jgi:hypothetical protein
MNTNTDKYGCALCKYKCNKKSNLDVHLSTKKHANAVLLSRDNKPSIENTTIHTVAPCSGLSLTPTTVPLNTGFYCKPCNFSSIKRTDYTRHISTKKHKSTCICTISVDNTHTLTPTILSPESGNLQNTLETLSGVVLQMVKQNTEFQQMMIHTQQQTHKQYCELVDSQRSTTVYNTHNTTNHFNLQVFLNVKCKDAINMSDFIHGLDIQPSDIEKFGRVGFAEGITQILMNGLNGLETHKRPIHCTDLKRDTMYIKAADGWEKDEENARLKRAIEIVEHNNCRIFCKNIPPSIESETDMIQYMTILREVNGGTSREKNRAKIIKNISKACFVER